MISSITCKKETEFNFSFPSDANHFSVMRVTQDTLLTLAVFSSFHLSILFGSASYDLVKLSV